jgi:hypothetical protein
VSATAAADAVQQHQLELVRSVMLPSFFEKIASLDGITPQNHEESQSLSLLADKVGHAVRTVYEELYSPSARYKAALDAAGIKPAAEAPAEAVAPDVSAFLADPAVKAAAEALTAAPAAGGRS